MKIMLGQTNPTPCDWVGNVAQIQDGIARAAKEEVALAAFPETSIPGYLCQDKMYEPDFVEANLRCLQDLIEFSRAVGPGKPDIVVGYIDANHKGYGKPFRNMAAVIRNGALVGTYQKQLLPYYDVFDEGRYFEPGEDTFTWRVGGHGESWGLLICEDWWNDKGQDDYYHFKNPVQRLRDVGIKRFLAINASPFCHGKIATRIAMGKTIGTHENTFVFVNQRGGMDELVFDGHSFVIHSNGLQHVCSETATPFYDIYEMHDNWVSGTYEPDEIKQTYEMLKLGLRDYVRKSGFTEVVVGSSGGIDSAFVLMLACDAIGPENVHGVRMPTIYNPEDDSSDAAMLHKNLGCHDHVVPITHMPFIDHINKCVKPQGQYNKVADENIQPRLRANVLLHLSNAYGWLVLTTGNKTESATGYFTMGGDGTGGFAPIKDLYKGEVYQLAVAMGDKRIQKSIVDKKPSARLRPDQFDEESLLPYPILDAIAEAYCEQHINTYNQFHMMIWKKAYPKRESWDRGGSKNEPHPLVTKWVRGQPRDEYDRIIGIIERNEFKRRTVPPGIKVCRVAFGMGRRVPIVKR